MTDLNWQEGNPLPNAGIAEIDLRKFTQYSMKPDNPRNQGKWKGFAILGYRVETIADRTIAAHNVVRQLHRALLSTTAYKSKNNPYGIRFEVTITIRGLNGRTGDLITIWQIDRDKTVPRLITNWVKVNN